MYWVFGVSFYILGGCVMEIWHALSSEPISSIISTESFVAVVWTVFFCLVSSIESSISTI